MRLRSFFLFIWILLTPVLLRATHNRAGEITYRWIDGYTYEVTIITYTKISSQIDRCELTVLWGDNTQSVLSRVNGGINGPCAPTATHGEDIGNDVQRNIYRGTHTYPSPGYYTIAMQDLNRNSGVNNISNSVQIPFYISTTLLVNPAIGPNNSPQLLNPPIDQGCVQRLFIHNAGAYDPDGDSLAYELVYCKGLNGINLTETYNPQLVKDSVRIDEISGDFIWDLPRIVGQFNFAFVIKEYRRGLNGNYQLIGSVTRDMQIDINPCGNLPPVIAPHTEYCVEAGSNLSFDVVVNDPDLDDVILSATGGPFEETPSAVFPNPATGSVPMTRTFSWTPACDQVQIQPFWVTFRAEDIPDSPPSLVDIETVSIRVIGPSPKNPAATANDRSIDLGWNSSVCPDVTGYDIYRRKGSYGFVPDDCETGVPAYTGYVKIGSTSGLNQTQYTDSTDLDMGVEYCYMVVALFPDRSESYASVEFCAELPKTLPIITHVDVRHTDEIEGSIGLRWIPARNLDSVSFPPPYRYIVERAEGIEGAVFSQIADLPDTDTSYVDSLLNTVASGWNYRIRLLSGAVLDEVGVSDEASSVFATAIPRNEAVEILFDARTAWINDTVIVFRETGSGVFDSIGLGLNMRYIDTGLANGETYCYYGTAIGRFNGTNMPGPLFNRSQRVCGEPVDINAPCPPEIQWAADCENNYLRIDWQNPDGCDNDIAYFNIYYRPTPESDWPQQPLVTGITGNFFVFDEGSIVGCYAVTAVDDAANPNESGIFETFCIDGCPELLLPNAFSPNNDGLNDFFFPVRDASGEPIFNDIERFGIEVFNRWGRMVYRSDDAVDFVQKGWDGTDRTTGLPCPEGVYYYICSYRARSLGNVPETIIKGDIHLFH